MPVNGGVAHYGFSPSSQDEGGIASLIEELYEMSGSCSFATFAGRAESETGVILLCGFGERFRTLSVLRHVTEHCLIVQDAQAPWFSGSATCRGIGHIRRVAELAFPLVKRWLLIGQSSGGYAALYLSRLMPHSIALAFSPQTFDDSRIKGNKLLSPERFKLSSTSLATHPIRDLRKLFFSEPAVDSRCYIISAYSEHGNPPTQWLWLDAMHWGRLVDHIDVTVFLTEQTSHAILHRQVSRFSRLAGEIAIALDWSAKSLTNVISDSLYEPAGQHASLA
jgi:hypothetical protein